MATQIKPEGWACALVLASDKLSQVLAVLAQANEFSHSIQLKWLETAFDHLLDLMLHRSSQAYLEVCLADLD